MPDQVEFLDGIEEDSVPDILPVEVKTVKKVKIKKAKKGTDGSDWMSQFSKFIQRGAPEATKHRDSVPTRSPMLNLALHWGGWPMGTIGRIWGPEGVGKTALCMGIAAKAQELGKQIVWIDTENSFNDNIARMNGLDPDKVILIDSSVDEVLSIEMASRIANGFFHQHRTDAGVLVFIDSLDNLPTISEIEGDISDLHMAAAPRVLTRWLKVVKSLIGEQSALIFVQQVRANLEPMSRSKKMAAGGWALKHNAHVELILSRRGNMAGSEGGNLKGTVVSWSLKKNKTWLPGISNEYLLRYDYGIDTPFELVTLGVQAGLMIKSGSMYSFCETYDPEGAIGSFRGMEKAREFLIDNPAFMERLNTDVIAILGPGIQYRADPDEEGGDE